MRKIKAIIIASVIALLVFFLAFWGVNFTMRLMVGHGNEVEVPDLIDTNYEVARNKSQNMDLYIQQMEIVHSDEFAKGRIISQDPAPGIMTKKFRTIRVVVSNGPEMVRTPNLANRTISEARLVLENTGLKLGEVSHRYHDEVSEDRIIFSNPMADEMIPRRSSVDVVVSMGQYTTPSDRTDRWRNLLDSGE